MRKLIFLMGAPTSLSWDENELLTTYIYPFHGQHVANEDTRPSSDRGSVKWRLLQSSRSSNDARNDEETLFFTTRDFATASGKSMADPEDPILSQFYDHSFTIHETSEISLSGIFSGDSIHESGIWADSIESSVGVTADRDAPPSCFIPIQGGISDLKDIPNTNYLQSIVPQTMTVNLIVGILTVHPPRRVVTRQWQRELDMVEIVVADETRTGFGITFWLPPQDRTSETAGSGEIENDLGKTLAGLRPRDIVLLRTVGLSSFRERVYGQSLRKGFTKVDLLHRQPVDITDAGGIYSLRMINAANDDQLIKVRKVREWILRFVSPTDRAGGGTGMCHSGGQTLPPDTQ